MADLRKIAGAFAGLVVLLGALAGLFVYANLHKPYQGFTEPAFVDFKRGTTTAEIAAELESKGVVQARWLFLAARAMRRGTHLQAGEYRFDKPATPLEVYARIAKGDIFHIELTIPEGYNIFDIAAAIEKQGIAKLGTIKPEAFLAIARSPAMIRDLDPKATSLEGYLFPNTYRIYRHTTAEMLARQMTNEFRGRWKLLETRADVHNTVTLAAMVEREAKLPEEAPKVSSVFHNRLRAGIKLDCDPTTIYAALLDNRYRGVIHQSDLDSQNPYNTYRHAGLPPGPIANPGMRAIQAALHPVESKWIFFVAKADGSGGHTFTETIGQHLAAVKQFRKNAAK
jgi:UPF0755 protein